jgi:hypothetical protein
MDKDKKTDILNIIQILNYKNLEIE